MSGETFGEEAVGSVAAGDEGEGARCIVVTVIVGDSDCGGGGDEGEEKGWVLHFEV